MSGYDLIEALDHIDPASLPYDDWLRVGQALHHEGYGKDAWRDWSRRDASRFNERDFESKWRGFGNESGAPVTGGTIVKMAKDAGWMPERQHRALAWDDVIGGREAKERAREHATVADEPAIVDPTMVGDFDADVKPLYPIGHEADELRDFLDAMFEDGEHVGYVLAAEQRDGRLAPADKGIYSRTAAQIKEALHSGIDNAIGTVDAEAGAWVRVNPLDGQGVGNANVTDYRHALLESDDMPVGKFAAIVRQLNLPVTALVDSGGKSLHALVKVDAADARQYRERVETLFARCEKNGISVDKANKNPSRLCRMPGVMRAGRRQFLAGLAQGAADWDEWDEWYAAETDELPDAAPLGIDLDGERPELPDALIDGILRTHDKMLLSGPSKAGKSFALMELCAAFATGGKWLGWRCRKSRVLYVNLELTAQSCRARFYDVFKAVGADNPSAVSVWNLKGRGTALSRLKAAMVRRVRKTGAEVIIIDPIYKVMMGDESSAKDIGEFTNTLDEIVEESGASLIYCHHHSKGFQGEKRSIDRASGSGVFGRDADAIVDMIELDPDDKARTRHVSAKQCAAWRRAVENAGKADEWIALGSDVNTVEQRARDEAAKLLDGQAWAETCAKADEIARRGQAMTAWRIEATLREFERPAPVHAWFDWPVHAIDDELKKAPEAGGEQPKRKGKKPDTRTEKPDNDQSEAYAEINAAIEKAVRYCADDDVPPTRENVRIRIPDVAGKPPTKRQILDWTRKDKTWSQWCMGGVVEGSESGEKLVVKKQ